MKTILRFSVVWVISMTTVFIGTNAVKAQQQLPDLLAYCGGIQPSVVQPGDSLTMEFKITNLGYLASGPSNTYLYLSLDNMLGNNDILLKIVPTPSLNPQLFVSATVKLGIPMINFAGPAFILVVADGDYAIAELNENNNICHKPLTIGGSVLLPDLVVVDPVLSPTSIPPGGTLSVSCVVKNLGQGNAGPSMLYYYYSVDNVLDPADLLLGTDFVDALAPGAISPEDAHFVIQGSGAPANSAHYILFKADGSLVITESNESNNLAHKPFTFIYQNLLPDLTAYCGGIQPSTVAPGDSLFMEFKISNIGSLASPPSQTYFYFSADYILDSNDVLLAVHTTSGLLPQTHVVATKKLGIPSTAAPGQAFIFVMADGDYTITEIQENNNLCHKPVTIGIINLLPDLIVANPSVSPSGIPLGGTLSVGCLVKNIGSGAAGPSLLYYYFSEDASLNSNDMLLGTDSVDALAPGAMSQEGAQFVINPVTMPPANTHCYIIFVADGGLVITESNENNNIAHKPFTITWTNLMPDLLVESPALVVAGTPPTLSVTASCMVKNLGPCPAPQSMLHYYFSLDATLSNNDILLVADTVGPLAPGAFSPENETLVLPNIIIQPNTAAFIIFKADGPGVIPESNEGNNIKVKHIIYTLPFPDLIVHQPAVSLGANSQPGTVQAGCVVKNAGTAQAGPSMLHYYLSVDYTLSNNDLLLSVASVNALAPGAGSPENELLFIPAGTAPGYYYLIFKADGDGTVTESNENNNTAVKKFWFGTAMPDLAIKTFGFNASNNQPTGILNVFCHVKNIGMAVAPESILHYYFSWDQVISPGDSLFAIDTVKPLAPGQMSFENAPFVVPPIMAPGLHYIIVKADGPEAVIEMDELNNIRAKLLNIGPAPHFTITDPQAAMDTPDNLDGKSLPVYPNPATRSLNVNVLGQYELVELYNATGEPVASINVSGKDVEQIDLSGLPDGLYFIRATGSLGVVTTKFYKTE